MENLESSFVAGASFRSSTTVIRRLKLMTEAAREICSLVSDQYKKFSELSEVTFDGRYKVDSDECFLIRDYADTDGTFAAFQDIINGNWY